MKIKFHEIYEFFFFRYLKRKLKSSDMLNLDHCRACGYCCHYSVCNATPDEIDNIAKFLNIDSQELIKTKCGFGHFHDVYHGIITACIIYPRFLTKGKLDRSGKILGIMDFYDTKGCVFLSDDNKCLIHPVRPLQAREMKCWGQKNYSKPILAWDDDILKQRYNIIIERADDVGKKA